MQENVTEKQVTEMLQLADLDKDGKINYEGECIRNESTSSDNCWFGSVN